MIEIRPFRGIRYDLIRAGNPVHLVSPPYSILSGELYDRYATRSRNNVVHLCPRREADNDSNVNRLSRQPTMKLSDWLRNGLVKKDDRPKFYAYEQTCWGSEGRATCRGILGLLRLDPNNGQLVLPYHESERPSRYGHDQLLRTAMANICPVLALYDDPDGQLNDLLLSDHSPFPDMALTDDFDVEHRVFTLGGREQMAGVQDFFKDRELIVGEGQAAYQAALNYQKTRRLTEKTPQTEPQPYDYVMALFCNSNQPGLSIRAYHRVFKDLPGFDFAKLVKALNKLFYLNPVRSLRDIDGMMSDLRDAGRDRPAFVIVGGGAVGRRAGYVTSLDRRKASEFLADVPASDARRRLDVTLLEHMILQSLIGLSASEAEEQGYVEYFTDAKEAAQAARSKKAQLLILMKPTPMSAIRDVCASEDHLPPHTAAFGIF